MKKRILLHAAVLFVASATLSSVYAQARGFSNNGMEYLEGSSDLSHWNIGVYSQARDREVEVRRLKDRMDYSAMMGYVGYDMMRWIGIYVTAGGAQVDIGNEGQSSGTYGLGLKFNLLDHEIMDPTLIEDKIRINGNLQYSQWQAASRREEFDVGEISGSLTFSIVNDIEGNALFLPEGIAIFVGGVYSDLIGDVQEDQAVSYTGGLEIFYTKRITLEIRAEGWDDVSVMGGIHVRL